MSCIPRHGCYVCGFTSSGMSTETLTLHNISKRPTQRHIVDKWLEFLFLPRTNMWPNQNWKDIRLCSVHFKEEDFCDQQVCFGKILKDDAVPTKYPPNGHGQFAVLFPQGEELNTVTSEISPSAQDNDDIMVEPFSLKLDDSYSEIPPSPQDCEDMIIEPFTLRLEDSYSDQETTEEDNSGDSKEDLTRQLMLLDIMNNMCRLCGQRGTQLKPIFDSSSTEMNDICLSAKIHMHLPFKVNVDDKLPCHICSDCSVGLNRWHDLYVTCIAADTVLKKTFGGEPLMTSQSDWNHSAYRDQDLSNSCARDADLVVGVGSHEDITTLNVEFVTESLDEAKEQNEILCCVCGMNTPTKSPNQDDLFIKEFERFYTNVRFMGIKCDYCYELFCNLKDKEEHHKICRELSTICEICGRNVSRKNLSNHKCAIHQFLVHVCEKCGKCFETTHILNEHINRIHEQSHIPRFCCNLCCIAFVKKKAYVNHQKKHKKGKIKKGYQIKEQPEGEAYICPVCNEFYSDALSLVVHLTSKRKIKCPSCLKQVPNEKMLLVHVCGKYKCRFCPKTYNLKMKCVVHERLHTGE